MPSDREARGARLHTSQDKVIAILIRPMALAARVVLVLLFCWYPIAAHATPATPANPEGLASMVEIIQRESMFDPSEALLMRGASEALHAFLRQHGDDAERPLQTSIAGFRHEFDEATSRHPEMLAADLWYAAMHGLLQPLDEPYTRFLSPPEYRRLQARVDGTDECGLGCHLELDDEMTLTVAEAFDRRPAPDSLATGDRIIAINGRSTASLALSAAKALLAGPDGTRVRLTVRRNERTFELEVRRMRHEIPNVSWEMLQGRVGYVRLRAFSATVARDLDDALDAIDRKGATAYVLDLRDNRGGFVSSAVDVCSRFLAAGTRIMSLQQKRQPTITYTTYPAPRHAAPLVLLVNERSASASEIVAGCLQDYKVATLLGSRTYGKGLVQRLFPLPDGSALAISTGKYLTARGRDLNKHGIPPDVTVHQTTFTFPALDPQVRQAITLLQARRPELSKVSR